MNLCTFLLLRGFSTWGAKTSQAPCKVYALERAQRNLVHVGTSTASILPDIPTQ